MAQTAFQPSVHAQLLQRVFDFSNYGISKTLAESILLLDFTEADAARAQELNCKANEGALTEQEAAELDAYVNISGLLAYWQAKARQALWQLA